MRPLQPTRENLARVAQYLREGQLAILPTETVYGLAADATNTDAVAKVFNLKRRPADNPLIIHISSLSQIDQFAAKIPDTVHVLAEAFMPGPLTMVLPKHPSVSALVTGGLNTVAIRMPDHSACLAVMELGELCLAMPSANLFMGLSPTNVNMIDSEIANGVAMVVDGGPCSIGIESTVLDLTAEPSILRLGSISKAEIEQVLRVNVSEDSTVRKAPGMYRRHYSPRTKCTICSSLGPKEAGLVFDRPMNESQIQMPNTAAEYARQLYAHMAELDAKGLDEFKIQAPPETVEWAAVWDRLTKATA